MSFSGIDETLTCADCGQPFPFTAKEQEFYASKGFTAKPKRCKSCRELKKARREAKEGAGESGNDAVVRASEDGGGDDRGNRRHRPGGRR